MCNARLYRTCAIVVGGNYFYLINKYNFVNLLYCIVIAILKCQILTCLNGAKSIIRPAARAPYLAIYVACACKILLCTRTFSEITGNAVRLFLEITTVHSRSAGHALASPFATSTFIILQMMLINSYIIKHECYIKI